LVKQKIPCRIGRSIIYIPEIIEILHSFPTHSTCNEILLCNSRQTTANFIDFYILYNYLSTDAGRILRDTDKICYFLFFWSWQSVLLRLMN